MDNTQQQIVDEIKDYFSALFDQNKENFISSESFKVRPGYGPNKFYLDHAEGSYESSIHNLIHHILWEDGYYEKILEADQLIDVEQVINESPDDIYGSDDEELQDMLNLLFFEIIKHVGTLLQEFDFFDSTDYTNMGYIDDYEDSDDDDDSYLDDLLADLESGFDD